VNPERSDPEDATSSTVATAANPPQKGQGEGPNRRPSINQRLYNMVGFTSETAIARPSKTVIRDHRGAASRRRQNMDSAIDATWTGLGLASVLMM